MTELPERPGLQWGALSSMMSQVRGVMRHSDELQKEMTSVTAEAWSDDRMIRAVVGPRGQLVDLEIDPRVYRRPNSSQLAKTIVQTVQRAAEEASRKVKEILDENIPKDLRGGVTGSSRVEQMLRRSDADLLNDKKEQR